MLRIVTLMDNSEGGPGTVCEHGLSFHVELDGGSVLFDTGKSGAFLGNARALGVRPESAGALLVSHGHYDHGGGVRTLRETTSFRGPVWTGPGFFDLKWASENGQFRPLGVDFDPEWLESHGLEHRVADAGGSGPARFEVLPGLWAVNGFPGTRPLERPNPRFVVDRDDSRGVDDYRDEICLVAELPRGIAVVLGCAHPGMMNMLDAVRSLFGTRLVAVFGGSHLMDADPPRIEASLEYLAGSGCPLVALGHCTGESAGSLLARRLPGFRPLAPGAVFELAS